MATSVAQLLESLGLQAYLPVFQAYGITDMARFSTLSEADLDKMKIIKKKERKALLKEAKKYRKSASASSGVAIFSSRKQRARKPHQPPDETEEVSDPRELLTPSSVPTKQDFEKLIAKSKEANSALALAWRRVGKEAEVDEFEFTSELVQYSLDRVHENLNPTIEMYQKLHHFAALLDEYQKEIQHHGRNLSAVLNSSRKRRTLSRFNSRVRTELKWVLTESQVETNKKDIQAMQKRACLRISVPEGQKLWEQHFSDLDMDMVPWDRFIAAFQIFANQKLDMQEELLLKHILDNDNLGFVTPKDFNNFLKCFGPIQKAVANIKTIYNYKWFHGFLSVDEVIRHLSDQPPGTFLVRFSRSQGDAFALEYVEEKGKIRTVLIKNDMPDGVSIAEENNVEKTFPSVEKLIQHYADTLKTPFHSDIVHREWFHSIMTTEEAEAALAGKPIGTFLLRFSESGRFQYACSYVAQSPQTGRGQVRHVQIQKVPSGYIVDTTKLEGEKGDRKDEETGPSVIHHSLNQLVKAWRSKLRYNYSVENVPTLRIAEFLQADKPFDLQGPLLKPGSGDKQNYDTKVCAQTIATYPEKTLGYDVVCDQFFVRLLGNRTVFALADGCNWGPRPREAAMRATASIIDQLGDSVVQQQIRDTLDCNHFLLRSFLVAHEAIIAGKEDIWTAGTTTLMAGMVVEIDADADEWGLIVVSVGDCKCFVWHRDTGLCVDVTEGNRRNLRDARDCGGRLGPYDNHGQPDLRNLASYFWPLKSGDIVLAVSDGVHDNLDPEHLGFDPPELVDDLVVQNAPQELQDAAKAAKSWDDLDHKTTEKLKTWWMCHKMQSILNKCEEKNSIAFTQALIQHAKDTTVRNRTFMEENPSLPEPSNHKEYPGKMDHTSCIAITAGALFAKEKLSKVRKHISAISDGSLINLGNVVASTVEKKQKDKKKDKDKKSKKEAEKEKAAAAAKPKVQDLKEEVRQARSAVDEDDELDSIGKFSTISAGRIKSTLSSLQSIRPPGPFEALAPKLLSDVPKTTVLKHTSEYAKILEGPPSTKQQDPMSCGTVASGWSKSTWPFAVALDGTRQRLNDPNTTHWAVSISPHRASCVLTAGCAWGRPSYEAAKKSCATFFHHLTSTQSDIDNLQKAALCILRALDRTQESLLEGKELIDVGTCVIVGGVVMKMPENKWILLLVNVGNCKAYVWSPKDGSVRDVTSGNVSDRKDPGGRLGNYDNGKPDTRNLAVYTSDVEEGDIILLLSPGAYHNFDPELLGKSPAEVGVTDDVDAEWTSIKDPAAKDECRSRSLEELLEKAIPSDSKPADASRLGTLICNYCVEITEPLRRYMENPAHKEPSDHVKFPGKLGHAACLAFRVGPVPPTELTKEDLGARSMLTTLWKPMQGGV